MIFLQTIWQEMIKGINTILERSKTMREILIRGKRIDNGEWVEGIPITNKIGTFVCYEKNPHYFSQYCYMEIQDIVPVIPESVGQYTGLTDKNGKKIFEGDVVNITQYDNISHKTHRCCKSKVFFSNFAFRTNAAPEYEDEEPLSYWFWHDCDFEVIGNIHDNPELLEEQT